MYPMAVSMYPTAEEVANALVRKQNYREINSDLRESNYDLQRVREYLESEKREFLPYALLDATERRYVDINSEKGKDIWRKVFEFYQEHGLKEELYDVQDRFYMLTAPRWKQELLDFKADGIAALCKSVTLGIVWASSIIEGIRKRAYKKYFNKLLYPEKHKGLPTSTAS